MVGRSSRHYRQVAYSVVITRLIFPSDNIYGISLWDSRKSYVTPSLAAGYYMPVFTRHELVSIKPSFILYCFRGWFLSFHLLFTPIHHTRIWLVCDDGDSPRRFSPSGRHSASDSQCLHLSQAHRATCCVGSCRLCRFDVHYRKSAEYHS